MLCHVCKGCGSIMVTKPSLEWWDCPACFGAGVTMQHGPAMIGPGTRRKRGAKP
jgi:hypothetical protein